MGYNRSLIFLLAILWGWPQLVLALPSDRQKPIVIESDRAQHNDKTGVTVYQGSVVITQGTIRIRADKVSVNSMGNKVTKIVCTGKPAHYQQQPRPDAKLVTARANTIEYHLSKDAITLLGAASLEQEGSTLKGERINYDLQAELVEATGSATGNRRIQMVIPPQTPEGTE